jgi:thiamine transport system ATP-binding protein
MLTVEGAVVRFDGRTVLDAVDLLVDDGETVAVLGPSGCGKTTLLRVVAGLQPLDGGRVTWSGRDLASTPTHERHFGLVFQEYALFPHRDVAGNVEFGLRMTGETRAARAERVDEVLDLVGLSEFRDRRVAALSGGEQQRVALARALAVAPRLLMLDEPLGALDRSWRERLLSEIRGLLDSQRLAALYVTHDHGEAFAIANRVVVMRDGRIVQDGAPADVWAKPVDVTTAMFLGFGPAVTGEVRDGTMHTPWGELPARGGALQGPVDLVLRPDALHIDDAGSLRATVTRATLRAADVEVIAAPAAGPALRIAVTHRDAPRVGQQIALSIDPDAVLAYPRTAN